MPAVRLETSNHRARAAAGALVTAFAALFAAPGWAAAEAALRRVRKFAGFPLSSSPCYRNQPRPQHLRKCRSWRGGWLSQPVRTLSAHKPAAAATQASVIFNVLST